MRLFDFVLVVAILCVWAVIAFGEVTVYPRNPNPISPDQIWQNDLDLRDQTERRSGVFDSRTVAQLSATVPDRVGRAYYCSNCATQAVCVSTGIAQGAFASFSNRGTACN